MRFAGAKSRQRGASTVTGAVVVVVVGQHAAEERAETGETGADDAEGLFGRGPEGWGDAGVGLVGDAELFEACDAEDGGDEDAGGWVSAVLVGLGVEGGRGGEVGYAQHS